MDKTKLILIPTYFGTFDFVVDSGRISLPSIIRKTIAERNKYNIQSAYFDVKQDVNEDYVVAFKGIPFAALRPNKLEVKEGLDTSGLDNMVYLAAGTIKDGKPSFYCSDSDTIFLYAATDAQRMLYDKTWHDSDFSSIYRKVKIDKTGRIKLNPFEDSICVNNGVPVNTGRPHERKSERFTILTGHPSLYCVTLSKGYQPTL